MIILFSILAVLYVVALCFKDRILDYLAFLPSEPKIKDEQGFTIYTIRKGQHYCDQNFPKKLSTYMGMAFAFKFNSSASYTLPGAEQFDCNKLYGFSEDGPHENSARYGWRWLNGKLELLAYVYNNGKLFRDPGSFDPPVICSIEIDREYICRIYVGPDAYAFEVFPVGTEQVHRFNLPRTAGEDDSSWLLYPYFGGNLPAPHDITIKIKDLPIPL